LAAAHSSFVISKISALFDDARITDVALRPGGGVVRVRGSWEQLDETDIAWLQEMKFEDFCIDLIESAGGRLDFRVPMATVVVGDIRCHAVLGSALGVEPVLTLRMLGQNAPFICVDSVSLTNYSRLADCLLERGNILIAGPAGSGKTTLLRSLLDGLPHERVITIEDAAELALASPNAVSLVSRVANVEGQGEIGQDRLLIEALRMSPDRIAVGEVRGPELVTMLDALNTGHSGAGATIHANSLSAVASRLIAIGARAGISARALGLQVIDAFTLVAFVGRGHRIEAVGSFALGVGGLEVIPVGH
jgi:pilus assembly protein CpaF